jgi:hypothetical protein
MGYVHDTAMSIDTPLQNVIATVGTWTMVVASNLWTYNHTAAANISILKVPLVLPKNSVAGKGAKLVSVDIWWSNATADLTDNSAILYKATLPIQAGTLAAAVVTTTYDSGHDTAAKRYTQAQHKMTLTVTTPAWVDDDEEYFIEITNNAAASSVVKLQAIRANYTLRM